MTLLGVRTALPSALLLVAALAPSPVFAGTNLLPDLEMAPIFGVQLKTSATSGNRHLRFGTIVYNVGDGPMEVRASDARHGVMGRVVQAIKRPDGSFRKVVKDDAKVFYAGDGHDHWHIARFNRATLTALGGVPGQVGALRKIGFCLVDTLTMANPPPKTPAALAYGSCGTIHSERVKMGISVGWGDVYSPETKFQSINVTGLPAGKYRLCTTTNPRGIWTEKGANRSNNASWVDITLDAANQTMSVIGTGATPC